MIQSTSAREPALLMRHSPLISQYQYYRYPKVHYCPSIIPTDMIQSNIASVPVVLIRHSPLPSQYQSYRWDTSPLLSQYNWYETVNHSFSISPTDTRHSTTVQVSVLLIRLSPLLSQYTSAQVPVLNIQYSTLLPQYYSYWHDTVLYCLITSPSDTIQPTTVLVPVLQIW